MERIRRLFEDRDKDSKKGDFGKIAVIGGSEDFPNTPAISALASARSGSDIEIVLAPERSAESCSTFSPGLISRGLEGDILSSENVDRVVETVKECSAMVIGNGLGDSDKTWQAVRKILEKTSVPAVIDADALRPELKSLDFQGRKVVLTPHRGEFERIYGEEPGGDLGARKELVKKAARVFQATILLKAPVDIVSNGETTFTNETGNPYMTCGGTGDVLAGVCGALISRASALDSAITAARITGKAGDIAAERLSQSLTVEDVIESIPGAIEGIK